MDNSENKKMMTIVDKNGVEKQVEIISYFKLKSNDKNYVIYTEEKEDANGNIIILTAEAVEKEDGKFEFNAITDPNVINEIKTVLMELSK